MKQLVETATTTLVAVSAYFIALAVNVCLDTYYAYKEHQES